MPEKKKVPIYTRKAIENYQKKFDRVTLNLEKGMKDKIRERGESVNGLVNKLLQEWLESN